MVLSKQFVKIGMSYDPNKKWCVKNLFWNFGDSPSSDIGLKCSHEIKKCSDD